MSQRLVVVSNRVGPVKDTARAGGLAVALVDALSNYGGVWYGWSGKVAEGADTRIALETAGPLTLATLDLAQEDYDEYYTGFANSTLWPVFHYRTDLAQFDRRFYQGYARVNARFAQGLHPLLQPDDLIWVHDYHFLAFGEELRRMGAQQAMGFFLHIPFPPREILVTIPTHEQLVRALFAYDVLGFQTEGDCERFKDYVLREIGGTVDGDKASAFGRTITARAFPIGIDTDAFADFALSNEGRRQFDSMRDILQGRDQIIGVDRLDYTKGLPQRFEAFERLLEDYPENRGRLSFMQIAPPSRTEVEEYVEIREELERLSGRINGRFAEFDWTPLRYLNRSFSRTALAGLYRASRIGLVTPLRDGMNLVAKEYVAAQDPADPGVLVLSRFAGAAYQMPEALIVNPHDVQGVADALQTAHHMSLEERQERHAALMKGLRHDNVDRWRADFLDALEKAEPSTVIVPEGAGD